MMTALLTVESAPADAPVLVTRQAVEAAGSKVGVLPLGRHVRLESMLYGLLLPSGNDAAMALAQHVAGTASGGSSTRMNARGGQAGDGLHALLLAVGLRKPGQLLLRRRSRDARARRPRTAAHRQHRAYLSRRRLPFPIKGGRLFLYNNNPLLIYGYPGRDGPEDRLHRWPPANAWWQRPSATACAWASCCSTRPTRPSQASRSARQRIRERLPPGARARAADPARRLTAPGLNAGPRRPNAGANVREWRVNAGARRLTTAGPVGSILTDQSVSQRSGHGS